MGASFIAHHASITYARVITSKLQLPQALRVSNYPVDFFLC